MSTGDFNGKDLLPGRTISSGSAYPESAPAPIVPPSLHRIQQVLAAMAMHENQFARQTQIDAWRDYAEKNGIDEAQRMVMGSLIDCLVAADAIGLDVLSVAADVVANVREIGE